jgi:hypothetical protein
MSQTVDAGAMTACPACGVWTLNFTVPSVGDDAAWAEHARLHDAGCGWIASRGRAQPDAPG